MASETAFPAPQGARLYGMYAIAISVAVAGNLLIRIGERTGWLPSWGQAALAIVSTLPLGMAALLLWRLLRQDLDELFQRIVLEGFAFALAVYVPLAALYINLRTAAVWTPRLDPPDILLTPAILVFVGIELARRRYR